MIIDSERIPLSPSKIDLVPIDTIRPVWSVMIPVYNCIGYIEKTLNSVLRQDLGPDKMEIVVIDDCSTDGDVAELVEKIGGSRVRYFKQKTNLGHMRNFDTCINLAKGHYVHILHGDDEIIDGYYKEIESLFTEYPSIGAAFVEYEYMNAKSEKIWSHQKLSTHKGILPDFLTTIAENQRLQYCCITVKRSTYEQLGGFYGSAFCEDWIMWARIAASFEVAYSPNVLALYRVFLGNMTNSSLVSGEAFKGVLKGLEIIATFLPEKNKEKIMATSKKNIAETFSRHSHKIYHEMNNASTGLKQSYKALVLYPNGVTIKNSLLLILKTMVGYRKLKSYLKS